MPNICLVKTQARTDSLVPIHQKGVVHQDDLLGEFHCPPSCIFDHCHQLVKRMGKYIPINDLIEWFIIPMVNLDSYASLMS